MCILFDKSCVLVLLIVLVVLVTIPLISILLGFALSYDPDAVDSKNATNATDTEDEQTLQSRILRNSKLIALRAKKIRILTDTEFLMDYTESLEYCESIKYSLPTPQSQDDEDEIIEKIDGVTNSKFCNQFFLGYRRDMQAVYQSLDRKKTWPSIDLSKEVAYPNLDRDCIEFAVNPFKYIRTLPCRNLTADCISTLHANLEFCLDNMYDCVDNFYGFKHSVELAYNNLQKNPMYKYHFGLVYFDPDNPPIALERSLPKKNLPVPNCYGLAVKYNFLYLTSDGKEMPYISDRFEMINPEDECVGIRPGSGKVVTTSCEIPSCVFCT